VLCADLDAENALKSLFTRFQALGVREFSHRILRHPNRDSGCRANAAAFLRPFAALDRRVLVVFDHHGCGREFEQTPETVESELEGELARNGWARDLVAAIVISPELESWIWSTSPLVSTALGFESSDDLRRFLEDKELIEPASAKPSDPKGAFEAALRAKGKPRSATIFSDLAARVSTKGCTDRGFLKFATALRTWFPRDNQPQDSE